MKLDYLKQCNSRWYYITDPSTNLVSPSVRHCASRRISQTPPFLRGTAKSQIHHQTPKWSRLSNLRLSLTHSYVLLECFQSKLRKAHAIRISARSTVTSPSLSTSVRCHPLTSCGTRADSRCPFHRGGLVWSLQDDLASLRKGRIRLRKRPVRQGRCR